MERAFHLLSAHRYSPGSPRCCRTCSARACPHSIFLRSSAQGCHTLSSYTELRHHTFLSSLPLGSTLPSYCNIVGFCLFSQTHYFDNSCSYQGYKTGVAHLPSLIMFLKTLLNNHLLVVSDFITTQYVISYYSTGSKGQFV